MEVRRFWVHQFFSTGDGRCSAMSGSRNIFRGLEGKGIATNFVEAYPGLAC